MAKSYLSAKEPIPFCCSMMKDCVEDDRLYIDYDPEDKGFFTPLAWPHEKVRQFFIYCPWCSLKIRAKIFEED